MQSRARLFIQDLRGSESSAELSARLGYATDVVGEWEAGRRWPTAAELFRVCGARRIDVATALRSFEPDAAPAFGDGSDREIAAWLRACVRGSDERRTAKQMGRPVATVRRWLGGRVRPNVPEMLNLLEATEPGRAEDFLQALLPLQDEQTPPPAERAALDRHSARRRSSASLGRAVDALQLARTVRHSLTTPPPAPRQVVPQSVEIEDEPTEEDEHTVEVFGSVQRAPGSMEAVYNAVTSADYRTLGPHRLGWLEARTSLDAEQVENALDALSRLGRVRFAEDRWQATGPLPQSAGAAPTSQSETPLQRLARRRGSQVAVSLSREDLARVRTLERRTAPELYAIAASTPRKEVLALIRVDGP